MARDTQKGDRLRRSGICAPESTHNSGVISPHRTETLVCP